MTHQIIKNIIGAILLTITLCVVSTPSVLAATDNQSLTAHPLVHDSVNDGSQRFVSHVSSTSNHNHSPAPTSIAHKSALPETGESISHSPIMAGFIALALGIIILIHRKIFVKK